MKPKNSVFIATSLDGYIADSNGGIDWLTSVPNPNNEDMGYISFSKNIDALVMGKTTFETVCGLDIDWPYTKPVFVLSNSMTTIPESHANKATLIKGSLNSILKQIHQKGYYRLYIDGGKTIQSFLEADLIDEMIITTIPIILGGGYPLFANNNNKLEFELVESLVFLNQISQNHYKRQR
jgi:dihydrofolate reductase